MWPVIVSMRGDKKNSQLHLQSVEAQLVDQARDGKVSSLKLMGATVLCP